MGEGGYPVARADLVESGGQGREATQVERSRQYDGRLPREGFTPVCALHQNIKNFRPTAVANRSLFFAALG